jgi:DNA-binding cell septation regulator SpoVG
MMINEQNYLELCKDAQVNYEMYKDEAEQQVIKMEYVTAKRYDLRPFWFEYQGEERGRVSNKETENYYGFDANGKISLTSSTGLIGGFAYTMYLENQIISRVYVNGKVDSIIDITLENGRPIRSVEFIVRFGVDIMKSWYFVDEYVYQSEQLIEVMRNYIGSRPTQIHYTYVFTLEYDDLGNLYKVLDKKKNILYINISKSEAAALSEEIKSALTAQNAQVFLSIRKKLQGEKVCFVAIYLHDEPHGIYDPIFHPGLASVRLEQFEHKTDLNTLWSSGEHPVTFQETLGDKELLEKLQKLTMYWNMKGNWWTQGKKLWQEIAYGLNQLDWSNQLPVTDDFIVFVDWEGLDVKKGGLEKCLPEEKNQALRAKGLLRGNKKT